jgi:hypothetical protein
MPTATLKISSPTLAARSDHPEFTWWIEAKLRISGPDLEGARRPRPGCKLNRIEHVTSTFCDRCFGFDQLGPLSIRPVHRASPDPRKRPVRLRTICHRTHGVRYSSGCHCAG